MLASARVTTVLPVRDVDRARRFYEQAIGLEPEGAHADGSFVMRAGGGAALALIPRPDRQPSAYTAASFEVPDLDSSMHDLEGRGVHFEDYDLPGLKTEGHVYTGADEKCAWFGDGEGNTLCLHQMLPVR